MSDKTVIGIMFGIGAIALVMFLKKGSDEERQAGMDEALSDIDRRGANFAIERLRLLRLNQRYGSSEELPTAAFVGGYEAGVRVEVPDVIVQNTATADISVELQLDKDGDVEYERVYVGPEDSKIMVGRIYRSVNHPFGWKAYTKFGIEPRYGRRQELLQWLVGRHLRRYGA